MPFRSLSIRVILPSMPTQSTTTSALRWLSPFYIFTGVVMILYVHGLHAVVLSGVFKTVVKGIHSNDSFAPIKAAHLTAKRPTGSAPQITTVHPSDSPFPRPNMRWGVYRLKEHLFIAQFLRNYNRSHIGIGTLRYSACPPSYSRRMCCYTPKGTGFPWDLNCRIETRAHGAIPAVPA